MTAKTLTKNRTKFTLPPMFPALSFFQSHTEYVEEWDFNPGVPDIEVYVFDYSTLILPVSCPA
jgi:hypothetical protein